MADEIAVRRALIDAAYRQGRGGAVMTVIAVLGVAAIHWQMAHELAVPPWLALMLVVSVVRFGLVRHVLRDPERFSPQARERLFVVPLLLTSLLWAAMPPLLFPSAEPAEELAISVVLAGMAGGAATVLAPLLWPARLYLGCMIAPGSVMLALHGGYGPGLGVLGLVYLAMMFHSHAQARRTLIDGEHRIQENRTLSSEAEAQRARAERLNLELSSAQERLVADNAALERIVAERTEGMRLAAVAIENTSEGVVVFDCEGIILQVNPAYTRITGIEPHEVIGRHVKTLRAPQHEDAFYDQMWQTINTDGVWVGEVWGRTKAGGAFLQRRTINAVRDASGRITHFVNVFGDITEARRKDEHIRHMAFHDVLTGLPNRQLLEDRLRHAIAVAERERTRLAVLFIDLDEFKGVNDGLGHEMGDLVLKQVAQRIAASVRSADTVARWGGDEFVVMVQGLRDARGCAVQAQAIIGALSEPLALVSHIFHLGASIGIAVYPDDGADVSTLMKNADTAMYAAKSAGRGSYRYFQAEMSQAVATRLQLESDLRRALEQGELILHYQPKVAAADGRVVGYEALLRWRHPGRGMVPPSDFIPVAESSGLIRQVGRWVIEHACRQIAAWAAAGRGWQRVAVNVSARQLHDDDVPSQIVNAAARAGITPDKLEVELTESVLMAQPEATAAVLQRLKQLGVTVAIDDFGTGYSSLAYLRQLPIDVLKIDRSFVGEAQIDANAQAIVRTVLALGKTLGLTVVAEGVETEGQAAILRELGCDHLQGYYYGRPKPAVDIDADWGADAPR